MNLRLSPGSIRLRISEEEARALLVVDRLHEVCVLPGGMNLMISAKLGVDSGCASAVTVNASDSLIQFTIAREPLEALLGQPPGKHWELRANPEPGAPSVALEIDAFSRKK